MTKQELAQKALSRARTGNSLTNLPAVYTGFMEKGIPMHDIKPRENVLTYQAWRALGRQVRKGEHGVKVLTFVGCEKEVETDGKIEVVAYKRPWTSTVFHVSQTDPIN